MWFRRQSPYDVERAELRSLIDRMGATLTTVTDSIRSLHGNVGTINHDLLGKYRALDARLASAEQKIAAMFNEMPNAVIVKNTRTDVHSMRDELAKIEERVAQIETMPPHEPDPRPKPKRKPRSRKA